MVKSIKRFYRFVQCSERYILVLCNCVETFNRFTEGIKEDESNFAEGPFLGAACD